MSKAITRRTVRTFIYQHFADSARPPTVAEAAAQFGTSSEQMANLYDELAARRMFILAPGTRDVWMAPPFSATPTPFPVHARGLRYWACCALDAIGVPWTLECDAEIPATCAQSGEPIDLRVENGHLIAPPVVAHFLVPMSSWFADLPYT
jgi:hypothetical protein